MSHHSARRCGSLEADVPLGCVTVGATNPLTLTTSGRSSWVNKTTGLLSDPQLFLRACGEKCDCAPQHQQHFSSCNCSNNAAKARHLHNLLTWDLVSSVLVAGSSQSSRQGHCCCKPTVAELNGEYACFQFSISSP